MVPQQIPAITYVYTAYVIVFDVQKIDKAEDNTPTNYQDADHADYQRNLVQYLHQNLQLSHMLGFQREVPKSKRPGADYQTSQLSQFYLCLAVCQPFERLMKTQLPS